jgi:hypothetical protein
MSAWRGIVREFREILPAIPEEFVVTLLEGNTPLVPAPRLAARIAPDLALHLKVEGANPQAVQGPRNDGSGLAGPAAGAERGPSTEMPRRPPRLTARPNSMPS